METLLHGFSLVSEQAICTVHLMCGLGSPRLPPYQRAKALTTTCLDGHGLFLVYFYVYFEWSLGILWPMVT